MEEAAWQPTAAAYKLIPFCSVLPDYTLGDSFSLPGLRDSALRSPKMKSTPRKDVLQS